MIREAQAFQTLLANAKHMTLEEFAAAFDEQRKEETEEDGPDHN